MFLVYLVIGALQMFCDDDDDDDDDMLTNVWARMKLESNYHQSCESEADQLPKCTKRESTKDKNNTLLLQCFDTVGWVI